jgi:uncharacterized protein YhbP (UPF0306 family)
MAKKGIAMAGPEDFAFDQDVRLLLTTSLTASLATVDKLGHPHACNVQYVSDEQCRVYFVSSPDSAHSQHIARDGHVALTVYGRDDRAENIHGLQMHGHAEMIEQGPQWHDAWELYTAKFVLIASMPQFQQLIEQQKFYRITPTWIRWIDNRRHFGFKAEKSLL